MKIHRGPRSTGTWTTTDEKSTLDFSNSWRPGSTLCFDGTIDKSGKRHTDLGVEINEQDIITLHAGLLKYYKSCAKERDELLKVVDKLETALTRISALVSFKRNLAPDEDSLFLAVEEIADHFGYSWNRDKPYKSRFKWLKWKSL